MNKSTWIHNNKRAIIAYVKRVYGVDIDSIEIRGWIDNDEYLYIACEKRETIAEYEVKS